MVDKERILFILERLDEKYSSALESEDSEGDATLYAKLALLEYCGWLEETFDDIARTSIDGKLKTEKYRRWLDEKIIKNTHGFQYKIHFIPMLMQAIGIVNVERLEVELEQDAKLDILKAELGQVRDARNDAAHTWLKGATKTYQAPSWTKKRFETVYPIIDFIDKRVSNLERENDD